MRKLTITLCALCTLIAAPAAAQRTNPLEGQPAVRKRLMLRDSRFELTPMVGFSLNRDFFHTILGGIKAEYHANDWLSVGLSFSGGAANIQTGLTDNVLAQLPDAYNGDAAHQLVPSKSMALKPMLRLQYLASAEAKVTPFFGKMALFGKLFFNYDFYGFGGFGAAGMADDCGSNGCVDVNGQDFSNPSKGFRPGGTYGVGFHLFFNNWIALNVELRDTVVRDNLAGRAITWNPVQGADGTLTPPKTNASDVSWDHIFVVFIGASFYLPASADISR
ncbi:MAG TPA: outer membrane beta-barrel domain-containing protein [Polyangia bacterium]|jgi:outer membrane beta-barrel protein